MEIVAEGVEVAGPHGPLLAPTSLRVRDGRPLLVTSDPGTGGTALALVLAGRLRPTRGTVLLDGAAAPKALRRRVAVVDSPEITEPEGSVSVRDVVAEGLSIAGRPARKSKVRAWLHRHELQQHADERFENVPATERTRLLVDLAAEGRGTDALILDHPDRHGAEPDDWYEPARREAERGRAVVVLCSPRSAEALPPAPARIGADDRELQQQ